MSDDKPDAKKPPANAWDAGFDWNSVSVDADVSIADLDGSIEHEPSDPPFLAAMFSEMTHPDRTPSADRSAFDISGVLTSLDDIRAVAFAAGPADGPLALIVLDEEGEPWRYRSALHRLGYRTKVRIGLSESLYALQGEQPDVVFLDAWTDLEGVQLLQIGVGQLPDLCARVVAVRHAVTDGLYDILYSLGVRTFIAGAAIDDAIQRALEHMGMQHEFVATPAITEPDTDPRVMPGVTIDGRFMVERMLGRGATAAVYQVRDLLLDVKCALKLMLPDTNIAHAAERFRREIKVTRMLSHPAIVRTWDFGELGGNPYYTMEVLEGRGLDSLIEGGVEQVPLNTRIQLIASAFSALSVLRRQGVLHRDLKPENLMVSADGTLRVVDFGMACFEGERELVDAENSLVGTPSHSAPEVLAGEAPCSMASDMYSMAVVAYELLTGRRPVEADGLLELLVEVPKAKILPLRRFAPAVPQEVDDWIVSCLSRNPEDRPKVPATIARDLDAAAARMR